MKKIIFATGNASKAQRFSKGLQENDIEVLSLKDLNISLKVEENGTTPIENALIKARECFKLTKMPTIGMDDSLYIEGIPASLQPGLYVRRVNGKNLNDEEMLKYYTDLVKEYGENGRLDCKWIYGLAVINERGEESTYTWNKDNIYMVDTLSDIILPDYPLYSITKYKKLDKYHTDMTDADLELVKADESDVVSFICNHV